MWTPWIGCDYDSHRLLLLGESCYSWDGEDGVVVHPQPNHPEVIVREALGDPTGSGRFTNMLTRSLCQKEWPSSEQAKSAWSKVAFTNYVPVAVGFGPRVRPSEESWKQADDEWQDVLAKLQPRNVIVLGLSMWGYMPETQEVRSKNVQGYRLRDGTAAMCWAVRHPSAGLSWSKLRDTIAEAEKASSTPVQGL